MRVEATGMPVFATNSLSSLLESRQPPPTYSTGFLAYMNILLLLSVEINDIMLSSS